MKDNFRNLVSMLIKHRSVMFILMCLMLIVPLPGMVAVAEVPCVWTNVETIVAVGDVHGDYDRFVAILQAAKVIDDKNKWIGETTHLVQNGDVLDRGPDSRKVMDLLMELEIQASSYGGAVHALIGNHEAMIMQKDLRYVHPGESESHGGETSFLNNMAPDGKYGSWICRHNAVIKINDTVFVHGGINPKYSMMSLQHINDRIREELKQPDKRRDDSFIKDSDGPLWYRGYAQMTDDEVAQTLPTVLIALKVSRMVIGHTVSKDGIISRHNGGVIMIDVGLSRAYGGKPACLKIQGSRLQIVELDLVRELSR
ncbi:metallophosphoesterase [bacterium]|nr:metallophosphoesterase [bacterium]